MTTTDYPNTAHETSHGLGYFDHGLLNVPQAQDHLIYAGYTNLNEELELVNAYVPRPLQDELQLQREYNPVRIDARKRAAIKMEALDNGSGRLVGSREFVDALATRLDTDVDARDASLLRERMGRLFGDESPHRVERARKGYSPTPATAPKALYVEKSHPLCTGKAVPRTVRNVTSISTRKQLPTAAEMLDPHGPPFHFSWDGLHPTTTLRQCEPVAPEKKPAALPTCIDPILLDPEAWHAPYRRQGLEIMIGSSYVFPRSDVLAPTTPKRAGKKRAATSKKITKAHEKTKAVIMKKTAAVCHKEKRAKPQQMHNAIPRRNSNYALI